MEQKSTSERLSSRQRWYREEYLRSEHWQKLKKAKFYKSGRRCHVCGAESNLDVHHCTYERIGREHLADLVVLCRPCHEREHSPFLSEEKRHQAARRIMVERKLRERERAAKAKRKYKRGTRVDYVFYFLRMQRAGIALRPKQADFLRKYRYLIRNIPI